MGLDEVIDDSAPAQHREDRRGGWVYTGAVVHIKKENSALEVRQ